MNELQKLIKEYKEKVANCDRLLEDKSRLTPKDIAVIQAQSQAYLQMQKDLEQLQILIEI